MQIGMIGLGKMGGNMAKRLLRADHSVVGYDRSEEALAALERDGGTAARSLEEVVRRLDPPRTAWLMIPSGPPVDETIDALLPLLGEGDTIVDGGNSNYRDSLRRAKAVEAAGLAFVDVGTSGGVWGLDGGYSMMVGGRPEAVDRLRPALETLAPGADRGWGHVGPPAAGHFVKMVHNGIEYGIMQAYAEGFAILRKKEEFELDLHQVSQIWRYGSVIRSWLLDLIGNALEENPTLDGIEPWVADSGEGRWTVAEAIDLDQAAPVTALALFARLRSRDAESWSDRLLNALRNQFGGHAVKREE